MSLIITVCTSEGIVLASDSRATYSKNEVNGSTKTILFGIHYTDTVYKTFLCDNRIGISSCGTGTINGLSIASHIENYINNEYSATDSVQETAIKLEAFFNSLQHYEPVILHIVGYEKIENKDVFRMYRVVTLKNINSLSIDNVCGARWDGEIDIVSRIIKNGYLIDENDVIRQSKLAIGIEENGSDNEKELKDCIILPNNAHRNPELNIAWDLLTLQDGIDFAQYAIKTTIDTMRFQLAPKTVGSPIDILVIRPNGAEWIQRKKLHA